MNFWKVLRWISAAIFIVLILIAALDRLHTDISNGAAPDAPRPAPIIVR